jgi:hypothetical protein
MVAAFLSEPFAMPLVEVALMAFFALGLAAGMNTGLWMLTVLVERNGSLVPVRVEATALPRPEPREVVLRPALSRVDQTGQQ